MIFLPSFEYSISLYNTILLETQIKSFVKKAIILKANNIIIVPETHWDREWYLPFQEFRARLVIMMDRLLDILKNDPDYKNFTFTIGILKF